MEYSSKGSDGLSVPPVASQHWLITLLLSLFSLGFYIPMWLRRLNKSLGREKFSSGLITTLYIGVAVTIALNLIHVVLLHLGAFWSAIGVSIFISIASFAVTVLAIISAFLARNILMGVYKENFNGVGTFFFNIFFLQIRVNTLNKQQGVHWRFTKEDVRLLGIFILVYAVYLTIILTAPEIPLTL